MEDVKIRIIVTDGDLKKKLFFIMYETEPEKLFVCGLAMKKRSPPHTTYHKSGIIKQVNPHKIIRRAQPLNNRFKGSERLVSGSIDKDLKQLSHLNDFNDNKVDEIIYIDIRTIEKPKLNVSSYLIQAGNFDEIQNIYLQHILLNPAVRIITSTNPWILILTM